MNCTPIQITSKLRYFFHHMKPLLQLEIYVQNVCLSTRSMESAINCLSHGRMYRRISVDD